MKGLTLNYCFVIIILMMLSSCISLVNLNYETADVLEKGKVSGTASLSQDGNRSQELKDTVWSTRELSYGFRFGVGIGARSSISVRYENTFFEEGIRQKFFEVQYKLAIGRDLENSKKNVKFTLGFPAQLYYFEDYYVFSTNPRLYIGFFTSNPYFRLTLIPKIHVSWERQEGAELPFPIATAGLSTNLSFSNNLDRWAIIPEIGLLSGFDKKEGYNFSVGCGIVLKL